MSWCLKVGLLVQDLLHDSWVSRANGTAQSFNWMVFSPDHFLLVVGVWDWDYFIHCCLGVLSRPNWTEIYNDWYTGHNMPRQLRRALSEGGLVMSGSIIDLPTDMRTENLKCSREQIVSSSGKQTCPCSKTNKTTHVGHCCLFLLPTETAVNKQQR